MNCLPLLAVTVLMMANVAAAASRTWTDQQGRTVVGEFVGLSGDTVSLRTQDGRVFELPITRFSAADQEVARALAKTVSSVTPTMPAPKSMQESASIIDRLVDANLAAKNIKPNPSLSEEEFVRRIYLDVVGRIPSLEETNAYLQDISRDKRAKLIAKLLNSKGHFGHLFNYFADMLRLEEQNGFVTGASYIAWIRDCLEKNTPYDEMVRQMLTASGTTWQNPPAGYLMRDAGMPLDNLALTMQAFHAIDISCAQCHDHPFNEWTQMQFYQLAAFFGKTKTILRPDQPQFKDAYPKSKGWPTGRIVKELKDRNQYPKVDKYLLSSIRTPDFRVLDDPVRLSLKLPDDYKYKDGHPGDVLTPAVIYGQMPNLSDFDNPRKAFASWLIGDERFATAIANRLWKRAFGLGIGEPLIGIENLNETENPLLLKFLASEMRRLHFDLRAFEEILYNTKAYQRQAFTGLLEKGVPYHFPGPLLRRMSAEQVWDSFLTMILPDVDYFYRKRDYRELESALASRDMDTVSGPDALEMAQKIQELSERPGERYGWAPHPQDHTDDVVYLDERYQVYRIRNEVLVRAAELPQMVGANSLMRNLGQSDRLLIDGGRTTGSVPIVLALMNSEGTNNLTRPGSRILNAIDKGRAVGPKLETAFLSILNRMPNAEERTRAYKAINSDGAEGFKNVVWALINTREFLFVQ